MPTTPAEGDFKDQPSGVKCQGSTPENARLATSSSSAHESAKVPRVPRALPIAFSSQGHHSPTPRVHLQLSLFPAHHRWLGARSNLHFRIPGEFFDQCSGCLFRELTSLERGEVFRINVAMNGTRGRAHDLLLSFSRGSKRLSSAGNMD